DGSVVVRPLQCPPVIKPVCQNTYSPVKVYDESGCCFKYECQCICSGWGDPHYITFDGTYYSFQGNCSYVLVKEIDPRYKFSVVIENYYCDSPNGLSCPKSLTVFYKSYEIFMTQKEINGIFENLIYVNHKLVTPAYENNDFRITENGIETVVYIPAISAWVKFKGMMFSIQLPFSKFYNNTEGQCGTCDNNRKDDCRLPNGTIESSCGDMARHWPFNDTHCLPPAPTPPAPPGCDPAICKVLHSRVFEKCHDVISVEPFYEGCKFDSCHMINTSIGCSSLQIYAAACAAEGICIDWRSYTDGKCDYKCESPRVYEPCGPLIEPTCNSRYNTKFLAVNNEFSVMDTLREEGCYCPPGTTLSSPSSNVCLHSCGEYCDSAGSTWVSDCQECVCLSETLTVVCNPLTCPTAAPVICTKEGQVKVNETVGCCQTTKCACACPFCSFQKLGTVVPEGTCELCICDSTLKDPNTDLKLHMSVISFPLQGYEYQPVPGQCCGTCVQIACIIVLPDKTMQSIQPGTVWTPPNNKCVKYECVQIEHQFISMEATILCPEFNAKDCVPVSPNDMCMAVRANTRTSTTQCL
uniref:Mucin 5f n=1 Tax=Scleropages formosus TaxID=113540 RepID=A0A8C9SMI7_SCLFO